MFSTEERGSLIALGVQANLLSQGIEHIDKAHIVDFLGQDRLSKALRYVSTHKTAIETISEKELEKALGHIDRDSLRYAKTRTGRLNA